MNIKKLTAAIMALLMLVPMAAACSDTGILRNFAEHQVYAR